MMLYQVDEAKNFTFIGAFAHLLFPFTSMAGDGPIIPDLPPSVPKPSDPPVLPTPLLYPFDIYPRPQPVDFDPIPSSSRHCARSLEGDGATSDTAFASSACRRCSESATTRSEARRRPQRWDQRCPPSGGAVGGGHG
jgi:hypothetical protein